MKAVTEIQRSPKAEASSVLTHRELTDGEHNQSLGAEFLSTVNATRLVLRIALPQVVSHADTNDRSASRDLHHLRVRRYYWGLRGDDLAHGKRGQLELVRFGSRTMVPAKQLERLNGADLSMPDDPNPGGSTPPKSNVIGLKTPWPKGVSGNPAGRQKGSRNRLTERFVAALVEDFEAHGQPVIHRVRETDPVAYLNLCAKLCVKEASDESEELMSAEERRQLIRFLQEYLAGKHDQDSVPEGA